MTIILGLLGLPLCAEDDVELDDIRFGIAGHGRYGRWAEMKFQVRRTAKQKISQSENIEAEVIARDGDGVPVGFLSPLRENILEGKSHLSSLPVKMGPPKSGLTLRVLQGEAVLTERKFAEGSLGKLHRSTTDLIGILGKADVGLTQAVNWLARERTDDIEAFEIPDCTALPHDFRGYDAIERLMVVLGTENPLAGITQSQQSALLQWIQGGGRLTLAFCAGGETHFTNQSILKALVPHEVGAAVPLLTDTGVKSYISEPLPFELSAASDKPAVITVTAPRQQVVQWESGSAANDRPLVVESPLGFGRVTCVLLDLSHPRFTDWPGRSHFWTRVLYGKTLNAQEAESGVSGGRVTHRGYQDLAGQLRSALDQYDQVTPIHFYAVAGAMLVYLLILGPGEFFLLQQFSRQTMQVTWFILPLLVCGLVAGGIWVGRTSHGTQERVNHVELLDLDATSGKQRGLFWTGIFTPNSRDFSLAATPRLEPLLGTEIVRTEISWQALPGNGLGGIDTTPLASVMPNRYRIHSAAETTATLANLPIASAGSKLLTGNWWGKFAPGKNFSQLHRGKIKDFEGSFRNLSPFPLKQAFIAHGEYLYKAADDLQPGTTVSIDRLKRLHLESYLIRRTSIASNDITTPWNGDDPDVARILEVMMFHEASGGENYTVLSNRYQHDLDLSRLLKQGYAVLVGRVAKPLVQLTEDGSPLAPETTRRWSFVRVVYPVAARAEEPTASSAEKNSPDVKPLKFQTE